MHLHSGSADFDFKSGTLCLGCTIGIWCCIARRTRAPDRMAQTRPFAATATPVVKSDYKQETSLVVGMTAASKI